jgi:hypothetical protein
MSRYLMLVFTDPVAGREAAYNAWYDGVHLEEVCTVPGVLSARRLEVDPRSPVKSQSKYLALYELEVDDPSQVMAELGRRRGAGEMNMSDALDAASAKVCFFRYISSDPGD